MIDRKTIERKMVRTWKTLKFLQKAKEGDFTALEKWIQNVERFAVQLGLSADDAYEVAFEAYETIRNEINSIEDDETLFCLLYKICNNKVE